MTKISAPYFCCHCKKVCDSADKLYFIEETSSRGFCSESCIEDFYVPLIDHFALVEKQMRHELDCQGEDCLQLLNEQGVVEQSLSNPDEIWRIENSLGDEVYSFVKKMVDPSENTYYVMILCMIFNHRPSFIFMATATRKNELREKFQVGTKIEDISEFLSSAQEQQGTGSLKEEHLNFLEQKKSSLLAQLLSDRKEVDIEYEQFHLYEDFFQETLESPDEIYVQDDDGDELFNYIKAHDRDGVSFYYIVICVRIPDMEDVMLPILSFPTLDPKLCEHYRNGKRLTGNLIN